MKRIKTLLFITIFLIAAAMVFIGLNIYAEKANRKAAEQQRIEIGHYIIDSIDDVDVIIDDASFSGNVSGTGNNSEILSVSVFKSNYSETEIENILKKKYNNIKVYKPENFDQEQYPYNKLDLYPVPKEDGFYVVSYVDTAPYEFAMNGQ